MSNSIIQIDTSDIVEGKLAELEVAFSKLVEFVKTKESRPISYNIYFNENRTKVTVVQIHPDSTSFEYHMEVAAPEFSKFHEMLRLSSIEIYGKPSDNLLNLLKQKAQMLGSGKVAIHELHAGFARFGNQ